MIAEPVNEEIICFPLIKATLRSFCYYNSEDPPVGAEVKLLLQHYLRFTLVWSLPR